MHAQTLESIRSEIGRAHIVVTPRRVVEPTLYETESPRRILSRRERVEAAVRGDAHRVTGTQRTKKKSTMPLADDAFDHARIVSTIARLPAGQQGWLRYAYTESHQWDDEVNATRALWAAFEPTIVGARKETVQKLKGLAYFALQEYRRRINTDQRLYSIEDLCRLLGDLTLDAWKKRWSPRWLAMLAILERHDAEALEALARLTPKLPRSARQ